MLRGGRRKAGPRTAKGFSLNRVNRNGLGECGVKERARDVSERWLKKTHGQLQ